MGDGKWVDHINPKNATTNFKGTFFITPGGTKGRIDIIHAIDTGYYGQDHCANTTWKGTGRNGGI